MKNHVFLIILIFTFAAEIAAIIIFAAAGTDFSQDSVVINEAVQSVQTCKSSMEGYKDLTGLDYVVINDDGAVVFKTRLGLSENVNDGIIHRDTILDISFADLTEGKIIFYNYAGESFKTVRRHEVIILAASVLIQLLICVIYILYINRTVVMPFNRLKGFAARVAEGNLDIPLKMDKKNLFGAFTESFDIMRLELKKARIAEAEANESKKELVAKLSHDIKTPVASIKAAAEVGAALTDDDKTRNNYRQIISKAGQINTLVTNLFISALKELKELSVNPCDMPSRELKGILESADYLHRGTVPCIPDRILYADPLRLQQVFDNIFANSYKYANTAIAIEAGIEENKLCISIEDYGGGVDAEELSLLKEKFKRGSNSGGVEGAGLGLYISDCFMRAMDGGLLIQNGSRGLKAYVIISLSGKH